MFIHGRETDKPPVESFVKCNELKESFLPLELPSALYDMGIEDPERIKPLVFGIFSDYVRENL